ncbi:hypothetical protein Cni_G11052 [Canna indica]|uniref:Homeodomain-like superfamily protein n=1 Tax=Canna indica TaxID=4628 RepID=A0AAQ3K7V9_9LILI|nr:hypothetical protein Cni_G11052 [Canna indica]
MTSVSGKAKKVSISEEDVSLLVQRYNPTTILNLLQEVSQVACFKIDWNALVKRTATGITNAREYQMVWRYLAYHHPLLEKIEDGAEPLDDDSDLEIEVEAVPAPSSEALADADACVKALMPFGLPREQGVINRANVEAPATLNVLNDQTIRAPSEKQQLSRANRGINITVPSLHKHPLTTGTAEGLDGNGSAGTVFPTKKKRKLWTKEEDMELIAAVQKYGEGNWANILKGDFKHDRTASQLSQRWAIIRRRDSNLLTGSSNKTTSTTRSEERLATQKAISLALDMPKSGRLSAILSGGTQSMITTTSSSTVSAAQSEALPVSNQPLNQIQQSSNLATSQKISLATSIKPRTAPKKSLVPVKPSTGPNSLIQAAAFAAGGRIATPSTAASLFKAAQSKNAVHIRPGGGARPSQISNVKPLTVTNTTGQHPASARISRPVVTTVAPSLANTGSVSSGTTSGGQQVQGCSGRVANNPLDSASPTQQAILESNSDTISHEMTERKGDIDTSAIDVDELLAEEVKCADEMELDEIMACEHQPGPASLDTSANEDNDFDSAYDAEATADMQIDLPKSMVGENKNGTNKIDSSDVEAAENSGDHILIEKGSATSSGDCNKSTPVDNTQNDLENQEQLPDMDEKVQSIQVDQDTHQEDAALGSKDTISDHKNLTNDKQGE